MTQVMEADVAVVGGGPAGALAARDLASAGLDVVLLEKEGLPRYKTCGGGVVARALPLLGIDPAAVADRTCHACELNDLDSNLHFEVTRQAPLIVMTMRARLDAALVARAVECGARVVAPCPVTRLEMAPEHVDLLTPEGRVRARLALGADGAAGACALAGGFGPRPRAAPALEWELRVPPEILARFSRTARFDFGIPRHGYAWIFPKADHLSAGIVSVRRPEARLEALLRAYLARLGIDRIDGIEGHGFLIPLRPRRGGPARGRVLLVGDAAGLADPVTCEGITHALVSGRLAAAAVRDAGLEDVPRIADLYERSLHSEVLSELRWARILAKLLYRGPRTRRRLFATVGSTLVDAMAAVVTGERTYRDLLLDPMSYLRLAHRALRARPRAHPPRATG